MTSESSPDLIASTPRGGRAKQIGWGVTLLAGGAIAGAVLAGNLPASADNNASPSPGSSSSSGAAAQQGDRDGRGGHDEVALTGDTAAKVRAAALARVPGATVDRLEKDADGAVYEAHLTEADGSRVTVKVGANFAVTGVETGGPGDRDHGGPGDHGDRDEATLSGAAAAKVRAGALAQLPGATVDRVESDADGATYEAHVTKADGTRATVKFDKNYKVTGVGTGR